MIKSLKSRVLTLEEARQKTHHCMIAMENVDGSFTWEGVTYPDMESLDVALRNCKGILLIFNMIPEVLQKKGFLP